MYLVNNVLKNGYLAVPLLIITMNLLVSTLNQQLLNFLIFLQKEILSRRLFVILLL